MAAPKVHSPDSVTTNTVAAANRRVALSYYVSHIYRVFQLANDDTRLIGSRVEVKKPNSPKSTTK